MILLLHLRKIKINSLKWKCLSLRVINGVKISNLVISITNSHSTTQKVPLLPIFRAVGVPQWHSGRQNVDH